jgi:TonB family protein
MTTGGRCRLQSGKFFYAARCLAARAAYVLLDESRDLITDCPKTLNEGLGFCIAGERHREIISARRGRIGAVNLGRALVAYGFSGLVAFSPVYAQQAASSIRTGSAEVAALRLETYVPPAYPQIAQSARVTGEVVLEATIGTDGRAGELRVLRSVPLLDQAAIDAVRQWRFMLPAIRGNSAPLRVPISVVFQLGGSSMTLRMSEAVALHNPSLSRDFAVVFASNCPDGTHISFDSVTGVFENRRGGRTVRVDLWVEPADLDQIYEVIAQTGVMSDTTGAMANDGRTRSLRCGDTRARVRRASVRGCTGWPAGAPVSR